MSSELSEVFAGMRQIQQAEGAARRVSAGEYFEQVSHFAEANGMSLMKRSEIHYQLRVRLASGRVWLYNLYPGNSRVCSDPKYHGPFLCLPKPWTLGNVVHAALAARSSKEGQEQRR